MMMMMMMKMRMVMMIIALIMMKRSVDDDIGDYDSNTDDLNEKKNVWAEHRDKQKCQ